MGQSPREPGRLKGQAVRRRSKTAVVKEENGTSETAISRGEEDEDEIGRPDKSEGPRELTGPSAPFKCVPEERTRTAAVPIGAEESRLRGAEYYYPPRFRRSMAESGTPPPREPGRLKGQAVHRRSKTAVVKEENRTSDKAISRGEEDEDNIGRPDESEGPRELTEPSAPFECVPEERTRTVAVPIGDEESRLRGAEYYYPPRFRRSMAESGTWPWPGQG
ncbi:hypothetical protein NDU88_005824 [Pleurodeles waltl]|uniref:Uncharacterized protein n=1 Tax=Pleurodeles waltl TaxID=8319 RepID=A0AAV7TCQ3_PLEWA|nr:hypothetical protein NDU88_005824 [Pleurodeles waltl]